MNDDFSDKWCPFSRDELIKCKGGKCMAWDKLRKDCRLLAFSRDIGDNIRKLDNLVKGEFSP